MWDNLPEIELHSVKGSKLLLEFNQFCKNYQHSFEKFISEINKHKEAFTKKIDRLNKRGGTVGFGNFVEVNYFNPKNDQGRDDGAEPFTTSFEAFKDGINILIDTLQERLTLFTGDLVEPLDLYISHRDQTCKKQFDQAKQAFHELVEKETKHAEYKRLYHALCEESEEMEIEIEKALLSQI